MSANNPNARNAALDGLFARKSVRAFTGDPIGEKDVRIILEAACQAPTAGNQQLYSIINVRDQALKERLAITCDNQPFIAQASLVLVFCADVRRWHRAFLQAGATPREPGVGDLVLAVSDANIAAQNAVVAAESLGIGSCYIGDILEHFEEHRELLSLPEHVVPAAMLVFGYPTEQQAARQKPRRFDLDAVVFDDAYVDLDAPALERAIASKQPSASDAAATAGPDAYAKWVRAFCERKWNSDFSREMTRSCAAALDTFAREV